MTENLSTVAIICLLISILVSLVLHEFMHAYAGHLLGDDTASEGGRLSLNPLSHIDPFMTVLLPIITTIIFKFPILAARPVPFNPSRVKFDEFGAALIALAGPLTNLILAIIGGFFFSHVFMQGFLQELAYYFTLINVGLFVFNMIPIPPLDGSRVLFAVAPEGLQRFMSEIEPYGLMLVFALVLFTGFDGILQNIDQFILNLI